MALVVIQCETPGCGNSFSFDDASTDADAAGAAVGGWSKVDGKWQGCGDPASCPMKETAPEEEEAAPPEYIDTPLGRVRI